MQSIGSEKTYGPKMLHIGPYRIGSEKTTLDRLEFEGTTRHCMEFKTTKDKIDQCNKMLLFLNKIKKMHSPSKWAKWTTATR